MVSIREIRPKNLLSLLHSRSLPTEFVCDIPTGEIGSTSMLEKLMIVTIARLVQAESVLEFGTFNGETTSLFIKNNIGKNIHTIDLPFTNQIIDTDKLDLTIDIENDKFLTAIRSDDTDNSLLKLAKAQAVDLTLIKKSSLEVARSDLMENADFIFIDGGHTIDVIENDTNLSMQLLNDDGCILWHDFGSEIHQDVTTFLESQSASYPIFCIRGTSLAFYTKNDSFINSVT